MSKDWVATFASRVYDGEGKVKQDWSWRPNLRTIDGADWQSVVMGGGPAVGAAATGTCTFASNVITISSGSLPTTTFDANSNNSNQPTALAGKMVVITSTSPPVYGVVLSNTGTTVTVDRWNSLTSLGTAGSQPSGTQTYAILPGAAPSFWMALTSTAVSPVVADHTLTAELSSNGFARAVGGWTMTTTTNYPTSPPQFTLSYIFTSTQSSGSTTINAEAIFNAQNGGFMTFESVETAPPTLQLSDQLTQSVILTI